MSNVEWWFLSIFIALAVFLTYLFFQRIKKNRAIKRPFPDQWLSIVKKNLPVYNRLPRHLQWNLQDLMKRFLYEKQFIGCAGLVITDEVKVTIAAGACLLLLNRRHTHFQNLKWIYVYPDAFYSTRDEMDNVGVVARRTKGMLGESWQSGKVVLSWRAVESGVSDFNDGQNVLLHEFAHQLDHETGSTNGAPLMATRQAYSSWSQILSTEFEELRKKALNGEASILDFYGATNPAEFFAVVTETFYERPHEMRREHPQLFKEVCQYYNVDPTHWQTR